MTIEQAAAQFVTDAQTLDAPTRAALIAKLQGFTRPGGERLMLPGKVQVPADVVLATIERIKALDHASA